MNDYEKTKFQESIWKKKYEIQAFNGNNFFIGGKFKWPTKQGENGELSCSFSPRLADTRFFERLFTFISGVGLSPGGEREKKLALS